MWADSFEKNLPFKVDSYQVYVDNTKSNKVMFLLKDVFFECLSFYIYTIYVYMNKRFYFVYYHIYSSINLCINILRNICETYNFNIIAFDYSRNCSSADKLEIKVY